MNKRRVVPLSLHRFLPVRDLRKLVWATLAEFDKIIVQCSASAKINGVNTVLNTNEHKRVCHFFVYGADKGHLGLIKWLDAQGYPWNTSTLNKWACECAAENGHLHVLKWLHENDCRHYSVSASTCSCALKKGHLDVLKWMHEQDTFNSLNWGKRFLAAVAYGHLPVLKWLKAQFPTVQLDRFRWAAEGNEEVLHWLLEQEHPVTPP